MSRTLTTNTFISLDGVMQAPGGPEEDPTGGFTFGGWNAPYWDDVMGEVMGRFMGEPAALLLGRKTYEIFAAHWPFMPADDPAAAALNAMPKYVASRTLAAGDITWEGTSLLAGDAAEAVAALKEEDGPAIQVHGSSDLIQTLLQHDLVDVFNVWTFPVLLGVGKRLFGEGTAAGGLTLTETTTSTTGVVITRYERAGEVPRGDFQLPEPTEAELRRRASLVD
jgi:dihydrofolate reductase